MSPVKKSSDHQDRSNTGSLQHIHEKGQLILSPHSNHHGVLVDPADCCIDTQFQELKPEDANDDDDVMDPLQHTIVEKPQHLID